MRAGIESFEAAAHRGAGVVGVVGELGIDSVEEFGVESVGL